MRITVRLFLIVGAASLITTTAYFGLVLALLPLLQRPILPRLVQVPVLAVVVLTPVVGAAWWMFKKLREYYPVRRARAAAIVFGLFTPVSLGVAFPLSTLAGAYSEGLGRYPFFGLLGAFVGVVIMTALISFIPCAFTIWISRRDGDAYHTQ
jgi:hypothetical protein